MAFQLFHAFILCFLLSSFHVNSLSVEDYNISILNLVAKHTVDIDCTLRGNDLGEHIIDYNYVYTVDVPIIVKGDNTLTCNVKFLDDQTHGTFELFNYDRDQADCDDGPSFGWKVCNWQIQDLGLCFYVGGKCKIFLNYSH